MVIAVRQWTAITQVAEDTMTSPYLDHIRSTREIVKDLIVPREVALAKASAAAQRWGMERLLSFLRDELTRIDCKGRSG